MHEHEMSKPFFLCLAATLCHSHLLAENFYEVARWRLYQVVNFWTLIILFYLCQKIDIMLKVSEQFTKCFDWDFESVPTDNECSSL